MKNKSCSSGDFSLVLNSKNRIESKHFITYFLKSNTTAYGIIVSKKVSKLAVDRNKVKRQIRQLFRNHQNKISSIGLKIVVIAKASFLKEKYSLKKDQFAVTISKIEREVKNFEVSV